MCANTISDVVTVENSEASKLYLGFRLLCNFGSEVLKSMCASVLEEVRQLSHFFSGYAGMLIGATIFSSLIRHKAMFKTSQTLGCLTVSPREMRERNEGFLSLPSSLPHNPSSCGLITNRKTEILQSGRGFAGRLRACVLLRLECQGFEVMLMKILLELQI